MLVSVLIELVSAVLVLVSAVPVFFRAMLVHVSACEVAQVGQVCFALRMQPIQKFERQIEQTNW